MPKITKKTAPVKVEELEPAWERRGVRLYWGDVLDVLRRLPSRSVQTCITSPPYWGLRDYQTGEWEGGDPKCDHVERTKEDSHRSTTLGPSAAARARGDYSRVLPAENAAFKATAKQFTYQCKKCGARRIDAQIGSEMVPDCLGWARGSNCGRCHVCKMRLVCQQVYRVLRDDGTFWLNYGDSYGGGGNTQGDLVGGGQERGEKLFGSIRGRLKNPICPGNLVGVPWRMALALQADGWILRSDIPWVKRASMPESVIDRPAKALEYVFLLVKQTGYYFDMEAVRRCATSGTDLGILRSAIEDTTGMVSGAKTQTVRDRLAAGVDSRLGNPSGKRSFRNADLWFQSVESPHGLVGAGDEIVGIDVTSHGYTGAHYAVFPPKLIEPFILAGTSARGACAKCGAPWERVVERQPAAGYIDYEGKNLRGPHSNARCLLGHTRAQRNAGMEHNSPFVTGWQPTCTCHGEFVTKRVKTRRPVSLEKMGEDPNARDRSIPSNRNGITGSLDGVPRAEEEVEKNVEVYQSWLALADHPTRPCVVLDPFIGSGTTAAVSVRHGRHCWGIELSETYLVENAIPRVEEALERRARALNASLWD